MDAFTQLMVMWLASGAGKGAAPTPVRAPAWPTPASPPPIPAFQPAKPPKPADASRPATPLATLHHQSLAPPKAKPRAAPPKAAPRAAAPKPAPPAPSAPKAAARAAKSFFGGALKRAVPRAAVKLTPGVLTSTVTVARVQDVLNARGAGLKRDGLYGPKTAASWAKIAASKGLPHTIKRKGPKTAEVVTHTLDALSVPGIP